MQGLGFTDGRLDRAAALRVDENWLAQRLADDTTRFIRFYGDRPLIEVATDGIRLARMTRAEIDHLEASQSPVLLGLDENDAAVFAVGCAVSDDYQPASGNLKLIDLRSLALQACLPVGELGMLAQARSLLFWHERHMFCANCGCGTTAVEGGYRRHCGSCGADHFPRTDPVVIMVAIYKDKCLLGRGEHFAEGVYSALAGFMEPGETLEDAARREVLEEAGIRMGRIDYVLSQPWPFASSLMVGLIGEALDDAITIDPVEIEDARWFDANDLEAMLVDDHPGGLRTPPVMAIAHHLVVEALARVKKAT